MSKEDANILRQAAMIFREWEHPAHAERSEAIANELDPPIDRSLRGWVLVTDTNGGQSVQWATEHGVQLWTDDDVLRMSWDEMVKMGRTVEPFPQGYTEDEIMAVYPIEDILARKRFLTKLRDNRSES